MITVYVTMQPGQPICGTHEIHDTQIHMGTYIYELILLS